MTTAGLIVFYYLAAASITSALLAVTRHKPIHSMLWVLAVFLHVAGIFLFLGAEFLAAVQVIVYAGAILVFYLFFLMLIDLPSEAAAPRFSAHWPLCVAAGAAFATLIWYAQDVLGLPPGATVTAGGPPTGNLATVGSALFTEFVLPFEIVSLVLLAAIVGAVVMAKRKTEP
ncbi:MAG TPA: NADH-quinone oxidoreductase subunit J [Vicinamibacteria bacterium]|jgi:NADH-quinone oxidoreductase subunit J